MIKSAVTKLDNPTEIENLLQLVKEALPSDKYSNIQVSEQENEEAGTRACFKGYWGGGNRPVFIRVDKTPRTENGRKHVQRGYNTAHEVGISSGMGLEEALENHLIVPFDFHRDNGFTISVAPKIEGAVSIKRYKNKFNFQNFAKFFSQILSSAVFFRKKGFYHRDYSPFNLLVRENGDLEAWITDFANACEISEVREDYIPTAGARTIRHPRLSFAKIPSKYNDDCEVYALAHNMLIALNGEAAVEYDYLNGTGKNISTTESLVDINKNWLTEKHDEAIKQAIKKLPKWAKKRYGRLIYKAMAINKSYDSLLDFEKGFKKASRPSLLTKLKTETSGKIAAATLTAAIPLMIAGGTALNKRYTKNLETAVTEASKYVVSTDFNGSKLELVNNLLNFDISIIDKENHDFIYDEKKKPEYLSLKPGQLLTIITRPQEKPRPGNIGLAFPFFKGKIYIEGYLAKEFQTDTIISDPSKYDDFGPNLAYFDFKVPEDILDGNYTLVAELYSQDKPNPPNHSNALDNIKYEKSGKSINRKRIPVVIGNPRDKIHVDHLRLDFSEFIGFKNLEKEPYRNDPNLIDNKAIGPNVTYEFSIPELGFKKSMYVENHGLQSSHYPRIPLPSPKDSRERTLQLVVKSKDGILGYTFFPIRGDDIGGDGKFYWWESCPTDPNFSDKLVDYRKKIYQEVEK